MQRIERYGVIALVVLLVTILAVSLWGESKDGWKFWKKTPSPSESASAPERATRRATPTKNPASPFQGLPLSQERNTGEPPSNPVANRPTQPTSLAVDPLTGAPRSTVEGTAAIPTPGTQLPGSAGPAPRFEDATHPVMRGQLEPAPAKPAPAVVATRKYTVRSGDTLGGIAQAQLGSAQRWKELQALNGNIEPTKLREGMELVLPVGGAVATNDPAKPGPTVKPAPKLGGKGGYEVQRGDTLSHIAARELGDAQRWTEIRDLNPGIDPKSLSVGARLTMPAASAVAKADSGPRATVGWGPSTSGRKSRVQ